jgi:hypothetical protein
VLPEAEYREDHLPSAISIPLKVLDAGTVRQLDRARGDRLLPELAFDRSVN